MNSDYSIAVLISVHDADDAGHLARAFQSILDQDTKAAINIYMGIDGPVSDNLEKIIKECQPHIHSLIRFNKNKGLSQMLNALIDKLGDEKYVFRMDADDVCLHDRLSKQLLFMDSHPEVSVCGTAIIETDFEDYSRIIHYPAQHEKILETIARRNPLAHPTACFRGTVFLNHRYPETYKYNQDLALWGELLYNGHKFANLTEPLLLYRITGQYERRKKLEVSRSEFEIYLDIINKLSLKSRKKIYPLARFCFRKMPVSIQEWIYKSYLRTKI